MLKNMALQFTDLFNMTCVYCRVEDRLSVIIKTTPSCIKKKKKETLLLVWTRMAWPWIPEFTFPSKISSHKSWKTVQLSKMVCNNVPLTVKDLSTILYHQSFLVQFFLAAYWKLLPILFFLWFSIHWVFGKLFNSKAASRVPIIISITLMVSPAANWRVWSWQCV